MFLKCNKGVSLVEVMVAFTILCLVIFPVAGIFLSGNKITLDAGKGEEALNLARARLEELKNGSPVSPHPVLKEYRIEVKGENIACNGAYLKKITVIVYYENGEEEKEQSLSAYVQTGS